MILFSLHNYFDDVFYPHFFACYFEEVQKLLLSQISHTLKSCTIHILSVFFSAANCHMMKFHCVELDNQPGCDESQFFFWGVLLTIFWLLIF